MWTAIIGFFFGVFVTSIIVMAGENSRYSKREEEILKKHKK
jgi:hypothetical protein